MVAQLVMELVAAGAMVSTEGGRLICRMPTGQSLPPDLVARVRAHKDEIVRALDVAPLSETVRYLRATTPEERRAWEDAHAHDSAAYSLLRLQGSEEPR
jgi:hypothetical protein